MLVICPLSELLRQLFEIGGKQMETNKAIHVRLSHGNSTIARIIQSLMSLQLSRADPEVIFRNSAHSSRVIYGRDPGPVPGSRFLGRERQRPRQNFLSSYYEKSWNVVADLELELFSMDTQI